LSIDRITLKTNTLSILQIVVAMTKMLAQAIPPLSPPTKHLFRVYMTTSIWMGFIAISSLVLATIFWELVHASLQWGTYPIIGLVVGLLANRSVCVAKLAFQAHVQVRVKEDLGHNIKYADVEEEQDRGYLPSTRPNFSKPLDALDHVGAARMSTLRPLQKAQTLHIQSPSRRERTGTKRHRR
jgi:hypothetical protein